MGIVQFQPAKKEGARLVIALAGPTASGKTHSALLLAYGLTGRDATKIALLDTENRRGRLHADKIKSADPKAGDFFIGDLHPPFSPARYAKAIKEAQAAGFEVLIIDSGSHEYNGEGGVEDIAAREKTKWLPAKAAHKEFMRALLQSDMHIIICLRARDKVKVEKIAGKTTYIDQGLQPICERDFMFDTTASFMLHDNGKRREVIKLDTDLMPVLGKTEGYMTIEDGEAIRNWVNTGSTLDAEVEKKRNELISITEQGMLALREAWGACKVDMRKKLGGRPFVETLKESAQAFEDQKKGCPKKNQSSQSLKADALNAAMNDEADSPPEPDPQPEPEPEPEPKPEPEPEPEEKPETEPELEPENKDQSDEPDKSDDGSDDDMW